MVESEELNNDLGVQSNRTLQLGSHLSICWRMAARFSGVSEQGLWPLESSCWFLRYQESGRKKPPNIRETGKYIILEVLTRRQNHKQYCIRLSGLTTSCGKARQTDGEGKNQLKNTIQSGSSERIKSLILLRSSSVSVQGFAPRRRYFSCLSLRICCIQVDPTPPFN